MKSVIKKPQILNQRLGKGLYRSALMLALAGTLTACASYRDVPANAPVMEALSIMGQANHSCDRADGGQRLVWSQQPYGQYVYGADVSADGHLIGSVYSVLTPQNFKKLDSGQWSAQDVLCEFGQPAEIETLGLGEKREQIWSYRYKELNHWNNLLHIYMGKDGRQMTHWHTGPDPRFDRDCFFFEC
ncbi:hypothetical protein AAEX37_00529 [Oligella sp. MSHR50489EDL]